MVVDIRDYVQATRPPNVLDIIERGVLENFIAGYSHLAFSGTAVFYKVCDGLPDDEDIERVSSGGKAGSEWFHPFCRYYRYECGQNEVCRTFDRRVVRDYYRDTGKDPMLYRCHRQLWDMAYPLSVAGTLIGVFVAGQVIVRENDVNWRSALSAIVRYVDSESLEAAHPNQQWDIRQALNNAQLTQDYQKKAITVIEDNNKSTEGAKNITVANLVQRFMDFMAFGKVLQGLLEQLYDLKVHAAEQDLLRQMGTELTRTTRGPEQWWEVLAGVMQDFQRAVGVEGFDVYMRRHSNYVQRIDCSGVIEDGRAQRMPVIAYVELPEQELIQMGDDWHTERLLNYLDPEVMRYLYKCDLAGPEGQHTSTIIIVRGEPGSFRLRHFIGEFCGMVGLRTNVSSIQHQIARDRTEYRDRVRQVSHAAKTPLQVVLNETRRTYEKLATRSLSTDGKNDLRQEIARHLKTIQRNVKRVRGEMLGLHARLDIPREPVDIAHVLNELADEMEPLAVGKNCQFELTFPKGPVVCKVRRDDVCIALRNLLDNAVKFSFHRQRIRISVRNTASQTALIQIGNYGVGIPQERMDAIRELGRRGKVVDRERPHEKRPGTGLGLPIATKIIHNNGGSVNIESRPTNVDSRAEHLRYVTRVDVTLPLHGAVH
jgi:signal transduction histidine kinase